MAEAELLLDLDASLLADLGASAFSWSAGGEEADGGVALGEEADGGVALGLELGGEDDCAKADDSINPLSAVVINNF